MIEAQYCVYNYKKINSIAAMRWPRRPSKHWGARTKQAHRAILAKLLYLPVGGGKYPPIMPQSDGVGTQTPTWTSPICQTAKTAVHVHAYLTSFS